jgi:8-oxo-dGTP pyrophosphatase MutT (NUDIX family)
VPDGGKLPVPHPLPMGADRAALETADLRFLLVPKEALPHIRREGLAEAEPYPSLLEAQRARGRGERILVARASEGEGYPPGAFANLDPYRKPVKVWAGGGLVLRPGRPEPELLLIFRRRAWDLPKGKLDEGETLSACALREVREEVGITRLGLLAAAGTTAHGYPEGRRYVVKRTAWYFMQTPERTFRPEAREGIERVMWAPWGEAVERLGYASLRDHLRRLGPEAARRALG